MRNISGVAKAFYLSEIYSIDDLRTLFIERWNWDFPEIKEFYPNFPDELKGKIKKSEILAEKFQHKIILFELINVKNPEREFRSIERKIISSSDIKRLIDFAVFVFVTEDYKFIDFVKAKNLGQRLQIKRFSITPENRHKLRTPSEQLRNLDISNKEKSFRSIQQCIDKAFSTEAVTDRFYKGYSEVFEKLKNSLEKQNIAVKEKDKRLKEFIHQILNRIMFLYFIQKRGCFDGNKEFIVDFWDAYKARFKGKNKFHTDWLNILFFEALCKPPWEFKEKGYLGEFNTILRNAPYLNGGLFERNALDDIGWVIPDELFDDIFEFFESFNFTVQESTPLDIDIAIDPEMLGNIYEHTVNLEEKTEQQRMGVFYTPKIEIELMIKRALVEFLYRKTEYKKENLYRFVFDECSDLKKLFTKEEAERILQELDEIFILDPACGSGHYLVSTVKILYTLKETLWDYLNKKHVSKYEQKKKIIEKNIYGNDVKKWAVEIAKLRLWLELFVDAEWERLKHSYRPILPSLKFKIRVGDSIVQKLGNELIPLRKIKSLLAFRKSDLELLVRKKRHVYESGNAEEYRCTVLWEKKILQNALYDLETKLKKNIKNKYCLFRKTQGKLFKDKFDAEQKLLFEKQIKREISDLKKEVEEIEWLKEELKKLKEPPMIWDLAFAEVFAKKNGFDIVIANPPYVRHERIEDPTGFYPKTKYKDKLIEQTKIDWSYDYDGRPRFKPGSATHPIPKNFPKKSNLYVYFYLKGLKLLNPDGILCYISSNSWLDVGFGAKMQEILLKNVPIVAIYDSIKRSFKHADINTIIALMRAPVNRDNSKEKKNLENNRVRFVMFKKPYEEVMNAETFIEIEKDDGLKELIEGKMRITDTYRLHTATQKELLKYGMNEKEIYEGNKWGGKYLRAPDIFFTILEKGKGKLVRLVEIAEVNEGHSTGANDFFYISKDVARKFGIESKFLLPGLMKTRGFNRFVIRSADLDRYFLNVDLPRHRLRSSNLLRYIQFGETQGLHQRKTFKKKSDKKKSEWYISVVARRPAELVAPCGVGFTFFCAVNEAKAISSNSFTELRLNSSKDLLPLWGVLNSAFFWLQLEIIGRSSLGGGMLKVDPIEYRQTFVLYPSLLKDRAC